MFPHSNMPYTIPGLSTGFPQSKTVEIISRISLFNFRVRVTCKCIKCKPKRCCDKVPTACIAFHFHMCWSTRANCVGRLGICAIKECKRLLILDEAISQVPMPITVNFEALPSSLEVLRTGSGLNVVPYLNSAPNLKLLSCALFCGSYHHHNMIYNKVRTSWLLHCS